MAGEAGTDPPETAEFAAWAARFRAGDGDASRELLARFSSKLVTLAQSRIGPHLAAKADAEDAVQSALRTFVRRLGEDELELRDWESLSALLALLTLRKCDRQGQRHRAGKRNVRAEQSLVGLPELRGREPTPDEAAAYADLLGWLVRDLDERDRRAVGIVLGGGTPAEAAERLGCSARTVRRLFVRLRQKLLRETRGSG